jgi:GTPase
VPQRATVAIVGRPNVGKSTLFNRLLRRRAAVVHGQPGSTRDRHYGATTWNGRSFYVVDTGGLLPDAREGIEALVRESALVALDEADLLVMLVDVQTGVTDLDLQIARLLQRRPTPVLLVANKTEAAAGVGLAAEFWKLGLGEPIPISAVHGTGSGELLDRIVLGLPTARAADAESDAELRVAIIGRPNVGKSSLVNALLGETRALVSAEPGTTRDAIDSRLRWHGHDIDLIDTAGLRRRSRMTEAVDVFSAIRALRSIERADVCLLLVDASAGITVQDTRIAGYVHRAGRGLVVCFNKWDLVARDTHTADTWRRDF